MPKNPAGTLIVVPAKNGSGHYFEAKWRDGSGRQIKARLGRAHVEPRHEPLEGSDGWQRRYRKARGRPDPGVLTADDAAVAMRAAIQAQAERVVRPAGHDKVTFGRVADEWLAERAADVKDHALKASTARDYRSMLVRADDPLSGRGRSDASVSKRDDDGKPRQRRAWIMRAFDDVPVATMTAKDVDAFARTLRGAELSPATRRKYEVVVSMILDHAVTRGYIETNPLTTRPKAKSKRARRPAIRVYSLDVVEQIADAAGGQTGALIRTAALTGLRQGELIALRWHDVSWTGQAITVRHTYVAGEGEDVPKSGSSRTVAMSDQAGAVLDALSKRELWTKGTDLVFPGDLGEHLDPSTLRRLYMKARDAVIAKAAKDGDEIDRLPFHSLRHCFGSRCAAAGVPLSTLQAWMGHANVSTTMQYVHHAPQAHDAARLTAAFAGAVQQVEQEAMA